MVLHYFPSFPSNGYQSLHFKLTNSRTISLSVLYKLMRPITSSQSSSCHACQCPGTNQPQASTYHSYVVELFVTPNATQMPLLFETASLAFLLFDSIRISSCHLCDVPITLAATQHASFKCSLHHAVPECTRMFQSVFQCPVRLPSTSSFPRYSSRA